MDKYSCVGIRHLLPVEGQYVVSRRKVLECIYYGSRKFAHMLWLKSFRIFCGCLLIQEKLKKKCRWEKRNVG